MLIVPALQNSWPSPRLALQEKGHTVTPEKGGSSPENAWRQLKGPTQGDKICSDLLGGESPLQST